jgi:hypothetical protein
MLKNLFIIPVLPLLGQLHSYQLTKFTLSTVLPMYASNPPHTSNPVPFRYFKTSHEIIQLAVMLYVSFRLSLRNVEDLLHDRGVDVSYESVRYWWHRFGRKFS